MKIRSFALVLPLVILGAIPVRADDARTSQRGFAPQQNQTVVLAPNALENSALWTGLDDKDAMDKGKGSWRVTSDKTMMVRGAIGTPLDIGSLQDATIHASLRFKVP